MDQWIDIAKNYGLPGLIIGALGAFGYFRGWPFLVKMIEEAQAQRKIEIEKFDNTIRTRDALLVQQWQEHLKALDSITGEVRGLRDDLKVKPKRTVKRRT
jgi:hypothetical protein